MPSGGDWFTGYCRQEDDLVIFMNVGVPGKTGHDFANQYDEDSKTIVWFGKTGSHHQQNTCIDKPHRGTNQRNR